ncbi:MAG: Uma2 family endonuclease, partial [Symploca sp. SIO1A3]|nr:Uma2 family endonuclease [Symploca sp. SIO1A3]
GIYYLYEDERQPALIPDGFLSIGVPRRSLEKGRLSYVLWEENYIPPVLAMEIVSKKYNDEYEEKKDKYAQLGVKYYLIYNPNHWRRDKHQPFELYRLEQGEYILQTTEPYWIPEIGLGIGRSRVNHVGWEREWLLWYDREGNAYPIPEEVVETERQQKEFERQRAEQQQQLAEQQRQRAEQQQQRAERAEKALQKQQQQLAERALQEQQQQQQTLTQLFSLGLTIEEIATAFNITPNQVREILGQL